MFDSMFYFVHSCMNAITLLTSPHGALFGRKLVFDPRSPASLFMQRFSRHSEPTLPSSGGGMNSIDSSAAGSEGWITFFVPLYIIVLLI